MTYQIIEVGDGITVSGDIGDFVSLQLPERIREEYSVPRVLHWINSLTGRGLELRGIDPYGNCFFQITAPKLHGGE